MTRRFVADSPADRAPAGAAADPLAAALAARYGRVHGDAPAAPADPLVDRRRPVRVVVPDGYEDGYAYPVVVWLHDTGATEATVTATLAGMSDRNYLGLAVRGAACPGAGGSGFGWSDDAVEDLAARLPGLMTALAAEWHVHPDRVFLAGAGAGADAAAALAALKPDWFAGVSLLGGGTLPPDLPPCEFAEYPDPAEEWAAYAGEPGGLGGGDEEMIDAFDRPPVAGLRVLIAAGAGRREAPAALAAAAAWRACGANPEVRLAPGDPLSADALRAVDAWLMAGLGVGV